MNSEVRQQAAQWLVEFQLERPDRAARAQFTEWLRASPLHVRAYLELTALWEDASLYDRANELTPEGLIELARREATVVSLEDSERAPRRRRVVTAPISAGLLLLRKRIWRVAAVACAVLACVAAGLYASHHGRIYTTDVGEQRTLQLADGSVAELNADSRIRVRFSAHERAIELLGGQALFRVAPIKGRPFVVKTRDTLIRALGTEFDVNSLKDGLIVTVLGGRVTVSRPGESSRNSDSPVFEPVEVAAGEAVTVTGNAGVHKQAVNPAAATAWTQQQLSFLSTPLPEVAEEFNRFNTRKLVIETASLQEFRVNGLFPALDAASLPRFVRFLRNQPELQVSEYDNLITVTRK